MSFKDKKEMLKSITGLSYQLAKANFKLRNEGSYLGLFWYLLEPFLLFVVILGLRVAFSGGGAKDYPLYLLLGLIMFNFFSGTTGKATGFITSGGSLIKQVKINQEVVVVSQVIEASFSHFFEVVLFACFVIFYGSNVLWILFYPLIFIFYYMFILGFSFLLATFGVYVNDLNNVWKVITRVLFFFTPLFHSVSEGSFLYTANLFNPLFYFLEIGRSLMVYNKFPELWMVYVAIGFSIFFFVFGILIFEKFKFKFAELV